MTVNGSRHLFLYNLSPGTQQAPGFLRLPSRDHTACLFKSIRWFPPKNFIEFQAWSPFLENLKPLLRFLLHIFLRPLSIRPQCPLLSMVISALSITLLPTYLLLPCPWTGQGQRTCGPPDAAGLHLPAESSQQSQKLVEVGVQWPLEGNPFPISAY